MSFGIVLVGEKNFLVKVVKVCQGWGYPLTNVLYG